MFGYPEFKNISFRQSHIKAMLTGLKGTVLFDEPMSRHTSFRIGGPAEAMVFPDDEGDLSRIISLTDAEKIPLFVSGKGTNLLVGDRGIRGVVISLSSRLAGDCFRRITKIKEYGSEVYIYAGAGVSLTRLLKYTLQNGLTGLEFASGIPGSVGGAVVMNAGSYGKEIKDILYSVRIADRMGHLSDIPAKEITFRYRAASIPGLAVTGAVLRLQKGDRGKIETRMKENLLRKKESQPLSKPSAGSIFKNPDWTKAWKLIDSAGMRGTTIGGATVSTLHANFIINNGNATAGDVISLIRRIGKKVERETGATLELEVRIVGT